MKNIHIIPTDKPSKLIKQTNGKLRLSDIVFKGQIASGITQHIYITNDEEIKVGDWCICEYSDGCISVNTYKDSSGINKYKIILTTDQDLIVDGVQPIDDEFLQWICKNSSCEEVEITKRNKCRVVGCDLECILFKTCENIYIDYKIIIPKEEPKKKYVVILVGDGVPEQETIEEAAKDFFRKFKHTHSPDNYYLALIEFAKWQQEKSYSEEEVNRIIFKFTNDFDMKKNIEITLEEQNNWFEQFKKK